MHKAHQEAVREVCKKYNLSYAVVDDCVRWFARELRKDLMSGAVKSLRLFGIGYVYKRDTPYVRKKRISRRDDKNTKVHKKRVFLQRRVQTL